MYLIKTENLLLDNTPEFDIPVNNEAFSYDQLQAGVNKAINYMSSYTGSAATFGVIASDITLMMINLFSLFKCDIKNVNCCYFSPVLNPSEYFDNAIEVLVIEAGIDLDKSFFQNRGVNIIEIDKGDVLGKDVFEHLISTHVSASKALISQSSFHISKNQLFEYADWFRDKLSLRNETTIGINFNTNLNSTTKKLMPFLAAVKVVLLDFEDGLDDVCAKIEYHQIKTLFLSAPVLKKFIRFLKDHDRLLDIETVIICYDTQYSVNEIDLKHLHNYCPKFNQVICLFGYLTDELPQCYRSLTRQTKDFSPNIIGKSIFTGRNFIMDNRLKFLPADVVGSLFVQADHNGSLIKQKDKISHVSLSNRSFELFNTNYKARYNAEKVIQVLEFGLNEFFADGKRIDISTLERSIVNATGIDECKIIRKQVGEKELIACFYVSKAGITSQQLYEQLSAALKDTIVLGMEFIELPSLPLTAEGEVNLAALKHINFIARDVKNAINEALQEENNIDGFVTLSKISDANDYQFSTDLFSTISFAEDDSKSNEQAIDKEVNNLESLKGDKQAIIRGGELSAVKTSSESLITLLLKAIEQHPENGITYYSSKGEDKFELYSEIFNRSKRILTGLLNAGLKRGDNVVLQIGDNMEFFAAFWACLAGGIVPLEIGPITFYTKENSSANRLYNAWQLLNKPAIIASDELQPLLLQMRDSFELQDFNIITLGDIASNETAVISDNLNDGTAFMLLTSGSTGLPKCIPISHKSAIAHIWGMKQHLNISADNTIVNILPIDHITPILTLHIRGMVMGASQVHIDTPDFINDPLIWLDAIEKYQGTHTFSPNFAYKLVLDSLDKNTGRYWDLSSIQYFKNGGELVNYEVADSFVAKLKPFGITENNFQPAYGMTEAAGAITAVTGFNEELVYHLKKGTLTNNPLRTNAHDPERVTFMSVGKPIPGVSIRIVNEGKDIVYEGVIGQIQASGDVVTKGYINNEKANRTAFDGEWFNTGDFGFIKDGSLVVTGRVKDVIIINGINYYAYEFEQIIKSIPLLEPDSIAVVGVPDKERSTESLAIFFVSQTENFEKKRNISKKIRTTIISYFGVEPAFIVPVERDEFPRTESGKINKTKLLAGLLAGEFKGTINKLQHGVGHDSVPVKFFKKQWIRKKILYSYNRQLSGKVLIFSNDKKLTDQLISNIGKTKVIEVVTGDIYEQKGTSKYQIDSANQSHYRILIAAILSDGLAVSNIIYGLTSNTNNDTGDGSPFLQFLISALALIQNEVNIIVLTNRSNIEGCAIGTPKGLPWVSEGDSKINIKSIDIADGAAGIPPDFYEELYMDKNEQIAYKDDNRYINRLKPVDPAAICTGATHLKKNGIYIIFSADNPVSNTLCDLLQAEFKAKAVLLINSHAELPYLQVCIKTNKKDVDVDNCYLENLDILIKEIEKTHSTSLSGVLFIDSGKLSVDENEGADELSSISNLKFNIPIVDIILAKRDTVFCVTVSQFTYTGKQWVIPYPGNLLGNYSSIKKGENRLGAHITLVSTQNDVQSAINFAPAILMGLISGSSLVISTENAAISLKKYTENNYKDEQCHIYYTSGKPETYLTGIRKKFPALKNQLFARQIAAIPLKGQRVVYDALRLNGTAKINGPETAKNDTEKKLIDILENLLNKKEIGLTDNFFELGGNSLKAIQVISRVYKELNAVIEFKDIFKNPKIADLASVISNTYTHLYQSIEPVEPQPFYDLSHPQKRLWGLNEQEEDHIAYNMPMGYFLNGKVNVQLLEKSFKTLINRHEILRTVFITVKGEPKQKVNPGTNGFNLKYLDIRSEVDKDNLIGDVARDEFTCSFDLETGPLLRATVIHIEEEKYLLLFTMHHIISDGWSLQIIFNELIATYNACLSGGQPALADLKIHYKDYSAWYGKLLLSDDILVHKNYWAQKLGSKNFEAVIPADNNIVAGRNYDGNTRTFSLGREVVEKLGLFIGKHEVTTFILTQAIIKVLLSKYSGQKDVTIGAPMAGRGHKELEGQIGFYLNNLVLLDEVENDDSFLVFLSKVKQTSLEAYIHQVYPYDRLVEDMNMHLAKGRNPFYDVMIVMQADGILIGEESAANQTFIDIEVEPFAIDYTISKLDLTFFFKLEDDFSFDIEYRTDLFHVNTIEKIAADFKTLLLKVMENPDIPVGKLKTALISSEQKQEHCTFENIMSESLTEDF